MENNLEHCGCHSACGGLNQNSGCEDMGIVMYEDDLGNMQRQHNWNCHCSCGCKQNHSCGSMCMCCRPCDCDRGCGCHGHNGCIQPR